MKDVVVKSVRTFLPKMAAFYEENTSNMKMGNIDGMNSSMMTNDLKTTSWASLEEHSTNLLVLRNIPSLSERQYWKQVFAV